MERTALGILYSGSGLSLLSDGLRAPLSSGSQGKGTPDCLHLLNKQASRGSEPQLHGAPSPTPGLADAPRRGLWGPGDSGCASGLLGRGVHVLAHSVPCQLALLERGFP